MTLFIFHFLTIQIKAVLPYFTAHFHVRSWNISNTKKSGKRVERPSFFLVTDFEVFGYQMKQSFECLIQLLKPLIILGEIQSKRTLNFMIIKSTVISKPTIALKMLKHLSCKASPSLSLPSNVV